MDAPQPVPPGACPWTQRLVETPPWSPFRLAAAMAATLLAVFLSVEAALGRFGTGAWGGHGYPGGDFRLAVAMILLVAYLPAAFALVVRGARRTVEELGPALCASAEERAELVARAGRFDPAALRRAGLQGACVFLLVPLLTNLTAATYAVWQLGPEANTHRLLLPILGWFGGRFVFALITESRRLSHLGRERVQVDILDLKPVYPLVRQGLRQALLSAVLVALIALFFLGEPSLAPGLFPVVGFGVVLCSFLSAAALVLPLRGVHAAIAAAKEQELGWCNAAIHRARTAMTGRPSTEEEPAERRLADLVAYRGLVEHVSEWPFDAPAVLRSIATCAIPLGGWLGGALVERLVSAVVP